MAYKNIKNAGSNFPFLNLANLSGSLSILIRSRLWLQILIAMLFGVTFGLTVSPNGLDLLTQHSAALWIAWIALPGYLFLALIQMVVLPLVVSSIILGISSSGNPELLKRIGLRIVPYFILTTVVAVIIGIVLATNIKPGQYIDPDVLNFSEINIESSRIPTQATSLENQHLSLPKKILSIIPANPLKAALEGSMLQMVILAILIGIAVVSISAARAKPLIELCASLQEIAMKVVSWAMMIAPLAVFGLLAEVTFKMGFDAIFGMLVYVATVLIALALLLLFYMLIVTFLARYSPLGFLKHIKEVQLLAFSTSSSAAVMPLSIKTAQEKLKVRPAVAQFIIPLGATVNMDGTAVYQVVAAIFLTQIYGVDLTLSGLLLLTVTTVGASIGSPSTPGVGIVILATILESIGVPASGVALIIGVDRILDMSRTAINVSGDLTACLVLDRWLPDEEF